jgi:hypothetical protein
VGTRKPLVSDTRVGDPCRDARFRSGEAVVSVPFGSQRLRADSRFVTVAA